MSLQLQSRIYAYLEPAWFLLIGAYGGVLALLSMLLLLDRPLDILSLSALKDRFFSAFWLRMGPIFAARDSETAIPTLVPLASGVVLELGPGIGNQLPRYDASKLVKVYGVEPNADLHEELRKQIKACKLDDVYEIVPCGVEDSFQMERHGIVEGSIDTVLSVQVLCSVPNPDETLRRLYALLRPGGEMVVYEHVRSRDLVSAFIQNIYNILWPLFLGNCQLNRNTYASIMQAGEWAKVEIAVPTREDAWSVFPRITGRLWKKR